MKAQRHSSHVRSLFTWWWWQSAKLMSSEGWCWWAIACLSSCEKDADDSRKRLEIKGTPQRPTESSRKEFHYGLTCACAAGFCLIKANLKNASHSMCLDHPLKPTKPRTFRVRFCFNTLRQGRHARKSRWTCKSCPRLCLVLHPSWSSEWRHGFIFGTITVQTQETGLNLWPVSKRLVNRKGRFHCWVCWMRFGMMPCCVIAGVVVLDVEI